MTRFGVMKHLRVLEEANLVTPVKRGRIKLHYLNPVPIAQIAHRWVSKYAAPFADALVDLDERGRGGPVRVAHLAEEQSWTTAHVYQIFIAATPDQVWTAITDSEWTRRYFHSTRSWSRRSPGVPTGWCCRTVGRPATA